MKAGFQIILFSLLFAAGIPPVQGQAKSWSERMAATVMTLWKDSVGTEPGKPEKWNYDKGVVLKGREGVWHMAEPFYAEYAESFHEDAAFDDIARQFVLMESHVRDAKTGLLYHGWDESRQQRWANPHTGQSLNFWGRALGWYAMALVDVLDYFPKKHPQRELLIAKLRDTATAIAKYQDAKTGLWYEGLD